MYLWVSILSKYCTLPINCWCSVIQSCPTHCDPMDCSMPGFPVLHHLPELAQTRVHWVSDAIQPSHALSSLLLLPAIFPSIRVFSKKLALWIRWPKYWSFSFSSKEQVSFNFMATVTICSDFGAQENKVSHCFHVFPIYLPWNDGIGYHDLLFFFSECWVLRQFFSLSSFITFIKRLFSSSLLSAIKLVSSAYLRLLIFQS